MEELSGRVRDTVKPLDARDTTTPLKGLVRERRNYGDSLLKAGAVLLVIPDPITDAAAIPVLAAGKILSMRQSITIKDVYSDLEKTLSSLKSLSSSP